MIRFLPLLLTALLFPAARGESPFRFRQLDAGSLELSERGKPVYVYNFGMKLPAGVAERYRRSSYLHPVYAPDGTVITDDFNPNHAHHRGISWMWPVIRFQGKTYNTWELVGDMHDRFVRWVAQQTGPDTALLRVENGWFLGERKAVSENVEIQAHAVRDGLRRLDFTLRLEAVDEPVEIAGTPDEKKGYGGFSFRFAPRDGSEPKTVIRSEEGIAEKDGVLAVHRWAEVEGTFQGRREGGRVYDDPSNPGYPNGWLMRHGFGFLNVSYPGLKPIRLEAGKPLVLKYRVVLFSGDATPD